eukprot:1721587-Prorocentrum_lima.AAC.1
MAGLQRRNDTPITPVDAHQGGSKKKGSVGADRSSKSIGTTSTKLWPKTSSVPSLKPRTHTRNCSSRLVT